MLLLGIDLGTSSVKVSVVDVETQKSVASAQYPETEAPIIAPKPGWAEQDPEEWWHYIKQAILKVHSSHKYNPLDIAGIGIAYQMHGLVAIDKNGNPVRNSIIWCDSRAISYGEKAFQELGERPTLSSLLNSPGNFTAAKLAWVKDNEPEVFERIYKLMLPGDFIAFKFSNDITTTISALSEGIFWDFETQKVSEKLMSYFGFEGALIPEVAPVFGPHGYLSAAVAEELKMKPGIAVTYKAGDQPNNALSLNVMRAGEVAATAGTSGVIYGVADTLAYDKQSRVNSFAHVTHTANEAAIGVLLCINGCGILNKSIRQLAGSQSNYEAINREAESIPSGCEGLTMLPFGNGAERMLGNRQIGAVIDGWSFNIHKTAHFYRAAQEGIAFAFRYGMDILIENGISPSVIRAGHNNMFLSKVFSQSLVNILNLPVELYQTDGALGAALGAGIGLKVINQHELGKGLSLISTVTPTKDLALDDTYGRWLDLLNRYLGT